MKEHQLRRLMRLSRRTGVPMVVADGDDSFVLMDVDQFEELIDAGEEVVDELPDEFFEETDEEVVPPLEMYDSAPLLEESSQEALFSEELEEDIDISSSMQHRAAPIEIEEDESPPNVTSAVPENMLQEEEERFYLEPID